MINCFFFFLSFRLGRRTPQPVRRGVAAASSAATPPAPPPRLPPPPCLGWEQLLQDERFLAKFFQYFTSWERRSLAQASVTGQIISRKCKRCIVITTTIHPFYNNPTKYMHIHKQKFHLKSISKQKFLLQNVPEQKYLQTN